MDNWIIIFSLINFVYRRCIYFFGIFMYVLVWLIVYRFDGFKCVELGFFLFYMFFDKMIDEKLMEDGLIMLNLSCLDRFLWVI